MDITTAEQPRRTGASLNRGGSAQDYGTPWPFIAAVESRFGRIAFDLAASKENTKAQCYIDEARDSLSVDWAALPGNLWLNPPFSNIEPWAAKCARTAERGARILFLTPASIGSEWFAQHVWPNAYVLALRPRIVFDGQKDGKRDPYPKDLMLSCFGFGVTQCLAPWKWITVSTR